MHLPLLLDHCRCYVQFGPNCFSAETITFQQQSPGLHLLRTCLKACFLRYRRFSLKEAYRVLRPKGALRVAMLGLDDLVDTYQNNWRCMDWVKCPEFAFIQTRAEMTYIAFRWWGHQHLYNRGELQRDLRNAGFCDIRFETIGQIVSWNPGDLKTVWTAN